MRKVLYFFIAFLAMQIYYSCTSQSAKTEMVSTAEMSLAIDGMTCSEGCAKTIEKTVGALTGVTYSKVNFDEKTAVFKFDDAKTNEKDILAAIAALNDGQYKVSKVELKIEKKIEEGSGIEAVEEKLINDTTV